MKTLEKAITSAKKWANKTGNEYFVVFDHDLYDQPGNDYHTAISADLDTYFAGCEVLFSTSD